MKTIIKSTFFISVLLVSGMAHAETADEEIGIATGNLQMRSGQQERLLGQVFLAPAYFMLWITAHEGSHALWGLALGRDVVDFKPYPHYAIMRDDDGESHRVLLYGSVMFRYDNNEERWRSALISIAPAITDVVMFTAVDAALEHAVDPRSAAAPFLLIGGMITPLVDFVTGMNCMQDTCDWSRFSRDSGIPRSLLMMTGYAMASVALWRCLHHFRRIFMERMVRSESQQSVTVAPITTGELTGLGVSGSF